MRDVSLGRAVLLAIGYVVACLTLTVLYVIGWLVATRGWSGSWKFFWLIPYNVGRAYLALVFLPPGLFLFAWLAARVQR